MTQHWPIWPLTILSAVPRIFHTGPGPSGSPFSQTLHNYVQYITLIVFSHSFSSCFLHCSSICFNKRGPFIWITKLKASWNPSLCAYLYMWVRWCVSEVECVRSDQQNKLMFSALWMSIQKCMHVNDTLSYIWLPHILLL